MNQLRLPSYTLLKRRLMVKNITMRLSSVCKKACTHWDQAKISLDPLTGRNVKNINNE